VTGKTRRTPPAEAFAYLRMAEEFLAVSQRCLEEGLLKAAGLNAVHAAISAADAVCVFEVRERSSSFRHEDAAELLLGSGAPGAREKAAQLGAVLALKNLVEYESRLLRDGEARPLVKRASRLVEWASGVLRG